MPGKSAQFVFALLMLAVVLPASPLRAQETWADPPSGGSPESVLFESLPVVEAATLHIQTLKEAPASITIISSEEIRRYGWRTLGEALAAVRGLYLTYDRAYHYAGLRGFGLPGDYNTRFLVMLNGHDLTENVYSSNNFFGQDFGLDMDLVKRIEIVRGPSSALYGSNGIFATINIVTRSPAEARRLRVSTETGSFGEKKAEISSGLNLGHGANLLTSLSVFQNAGQSLYFPEFDRPQANYGWARGADGERGYHAFANLIWRNWSFTGYLGSRQKQIPTGWYNTLFGDPANNILDARGFFEAAYSRDLSATRKVRWRIYYDQYRYRGRYDYAVAGTVQDFRDLTAGDWVGTQASYDFRVPHVGVLTVGGELNADIRALQQYYEVSPRPVTVLSVDHPDLSYGLFAQQQWQLSPAWTAYLGARFDDSRNRKHFISPRLALVYQASTKSTYKFLFGRAFRNPNAYEMYYDDGFSQAANLALRPERANTYEITAERRFTNSLNGMVTLYHYQLDGLIEAGTNAAGWLQYQNVSRARATGVEMELGGKPAAWIETTASVALEHAAEQSRPYLTNSPGCIAKLRGSVPLFKDHLRAAAAMQYLSPRRTVAYAEVPSVWLTDLTLTTHRIHPDFEIQFGVRNLLDRAYYDPVGVGLVQDRLLEDGRALFLKLMWRTRE
ncbi:MAG TPA: TonB-dependent receptor [Bryobacterales bacterium]|nr:TonB-dependent receptor [Bryobacterales bacterium]